MLPPGKNLPALVCLTALLLAWGTASEARAEAEADIVVGYGAAEAGRFGSEAALQSAVLAQYGAANDVAARSGSPHRQRIAGFIKSATDCDYLTSTGGMVSWLSGNDSHVSDVVAYANSLGADLVTYIFKNGDSVAGVAQQPGRCSAYNDQVYWTYFAHESGGHNYGGNHGDATVDPKTIMANNYCGGGSQGYYTNPNIWLNNVKLLGTGNCTGGTIYGGDTAYLISTSAQGVANRYERLVYGSNLYPIVKRWQFNKTAAAAPAGTVVADDVGGAQAIVRGQGATFTGTGLKLPGGTTGNVAVNSIAAYIDLPNGTFSTLPNFTIEIWAAPLSVQNWERIIDIGRTVEAGDGLGAAGEYTGTTGSAAPGVTTASDNLVLSAAIGTNLNSQRFEARLDGANVQTGDSTLATTVGGLHHYAITFADTTTGGNVTWYRDGALVKTLAVAFHSAQIEDVNNWLGRSQYSADSLGNIEYRDLRIQSIALSAGNVAANYLIGPNDAKSTLYANDAYGSSGFVSGSWEFGSNVPVATRDYETGTLRLLSPYTTTDSTFPGRSLTVTGGNFFLAGKVAKTATVGDLRLNGGTIHSLGDNGTTQTLAGQITVQTNSYNQLRGENGPLVVSANIIGGVGGGSMVYTENAVTLTGNNTGYLGATIVGDGRFSTLRISNETNLGGNPTFYGGAWLQLNRGILVTTATMTIDDANRGVVIGPSGGIFRPDAGTTLTIATTVNSPAAGNTLQTAPLTSNPTQGILFKDGNGTLELTNPNNSHNAEMQILAGELKLTGNGRFNNGNHTWPITLNSLLTYGSAFNQTLGGVISGNGTLAKSNTSTLTLTGANTFSGSATVSGGTLYANAGNAATNRTFSYVSGLTVGNGGTLRSSANALFGWDGTQERPITVNAGGTLLADGNGDVGVGTVTLAGGTMATTVASTAYGSWRFDEATDRLLVTDNSTVSAANVKFGNASAAINVASGKTLNLTGTITDATTGGVSYLNKIGAGTLTLSGTNSFSGATTVSAGTLNLLGSLSGNSAVSVSGGAVLRGAGAIAGNLSFANSIHAPGNPTGVQTVGGTLVYDATSRFKFTLLSNGTAASAANGVAANGALTVASGAAVDLTFNAPGSTVNFYDVFWTQARSWVVASSNGLTGAFALGVISADANGQQAAVYGAFALVQNSVGVTLQWTPRGFFAWQGQNFGGNVASPAISGPLANPDNDDLPNLLEAFYATDPNAGNASPLQTQTVDGRLGLRFPRNTNITDVVAKVQGADDVAGPWTDLAQSVGGASFTPVANGATVIEDGTGSTRNVSFADVYLMSDPAHQRRFLRLWVQPQ